MNVRELIEYLQTLPPNTKVGEVSYDDLLMELEPRELSLVDYQDGKTGEWLVALNLTVHED